MTAMPPLRDILNNTPADAVNVDFNFNTLEAHVGSELVNRDGSVAMTGPLSLSGPPTAPQHAATKAYVDSPNVVPIATIWEYAGQAAPAGWALCDGSSKSTTDPAYAALFAAIGYAFGGAGANFNLPDRRGRVGVGRNAGDALFGTLGQAGGSRDLILPTHTHGLGAHTHAVGNHTHGMQGHTHYMAHKHDLAGHVHGTAFADGYDVHSGNQPGNTNAIFQPGGQMVSFITRPTAALASDVGAGGVNTGGAAGSTDWDDRANNHNSDGPSNNSTTGMEAGVNTSGPSVASDAAGVSPANGNVPPYVTVNYIIRIG